MSDKGRKLIGRRSDLGLSATEFAGMLGISRQALHAIETGQSIPSVRLAIQIARVLGSSVEEIFGGTEVEPVLDFEPRPGVRYRLALGSIGDRLVGRRLDSPGGRMSGNTTDALLEDGSVSTVTGATKSVFVSGCDPSLGIVVDWMSRRDPSYRYRWVSCQNSVAVSELRTGISHFAVVHGGSDLMGQDPQSESFPQQQTLELCEWTISLVVSPGNPFGIRSLEDALAGGYRCALRPDGSGAMDLLMRESMRLGYVADELPSDGLIHTDHRSAAVSVGSSKADYAMVATSVALDYDLEVLDSYQQSSTLLWSSESNQTPALERLRDELSSSTLRREVETLFGYSMLT